MAVKRPCVLMILDGFGLYSDYPFNAIRNANTPTLDNLFQTYPHSKLVCHGSAVGLPNEIMGNSEVGHLNIGAGRIVYQDLLRINRAIEQGSFFQNPVLKEQITKAKKGNGRVHLMGLASDGGVHSTMEHLNALLKLCRLEGLQENIFVHCFMDGRDTPPQSGVKYLEQIETYIETLGVGQIATLSGRFYAMDRDQRWDRVEKAYNNMVGVADRATGTVKTSALSPLKELEAQYAQGITDEFVEPVSFIQEGHIQDDDLIIFFNFRSDRAREMSQAFFDPDFNAFSRSYLSLSGFVSMVRYKESFTNPAAFVKDKLKNGLGETLAKHNKTQLRIAETEKYAHVTFFFNGQKEDPFPGEDRILIPSPSDVETYDLKPEMSAQKVTERLLEKLEAGNYDVYIVNYANSDMVGHTGVYDAAIKAVETLDACVKKIADKILALEGRMLICSDHGNSEQMQDDQGRPHTSHTLNPVPLIYISSQGSKGLKLADGTLADIMPTLLGLLEIPCPPEVTGKNLLGVGGV